MHSIQLLRTLPSTTKCKQMRYMHAKRIYKLNKFRKNLNCWSVRSISKNHSQLDVIPFARHISKLILYNEIAAAFEVMSNAHVVDALKWQSMSELILWSSHGIHSTINTKYVKEPRVVNWKTRYNLWLV